MKAFTEIIDKYLHNQLSEKERKDFELQLEKNDNLRRELELQREVMKGVEQLGIRTEIAKAVKGAKLASLLKNIALAVTTVAIIAGAIYFYSKALSESGRNELLHELNETGAANWSRADKVLPSQVFKINPRKDTIIETDNGIIIQVRADAFLDKFGEVPETAVELEIKEAMTAADIIKAGLSTTSNGRLLETGGMFYINARIGEETLTIDQSKPLQVSVPTGNNKEMSLFEGQRMENGDINWVNPKPMRKHLATVDITGLNFYPPHFLDSLAGMGVDIKNKALTDSIYYSFTNLFTCGEAAYNAPQLPLQPVKDSSAVVVFDKDGITYAATPPVRAALQPPRINVALTQGMSVNSNLTAANNPPDGEKLFRQNCSACHAAHSDKKLTGPGLLGVAGRVPKGRWLMDYIMNSERMIKSGDPYANKLYVEHGKAAMTVFEGTLSEEDVKAIIRYIGAAAPVKLSDEHENCVAEINPSRIKTIWDPKFNGTILATKEFEERLQLIFTTCNARLLSLYTENLDQDLCTLDSVAATLSESEAKEKFIRYSKLRLGGVPVSGEKNQALQRYFTAKKAIYDKAVREAMNKLYSHETDLANEASLKELKHDLEFNTNQQKLLSSEIKANMDEAYRQLGKRPPNVSVSTGPTAYLSSEVTTPGWYNVDRYVLVSTTGRTSLDYTDSATGKKAIIEYATTTVKVNGYDEYDRIVCYLLTDKLSSFQLMKDSAKTFSERLNRTFSNSLLIVGYKGDRTFFKDEKFAAAKNYTVDLEAIDPETLTRRINGRYNFAGTGDVIKDIDFHLFERKEAARAAKIEAREKLRGRIYRVVYPCMEYALN